jgi:hypothetical protein
MAGGRGGGHLRGTDAPPGRRSQLAARRRGPAGYLSDFGERVTENVVQDERDALGRGH